MHFFDAIAPPAGAIANRRIVCIRDELFPHPEVQECIAHGTGEGFAGAGWRVGSTLDQRDREAAPGERNRRRRAGGSATHDDDVELHQ
jgi:hypothetical protein